MPTLMNTGPGVEWPTPALLILPHPTEYTGDFNSHSTEWGYRVSAKAGDHLSQWANDKHLHLLYDPKQNDTFHSARWNKDYWLDICFVTCDDEHQPLPTTRTIEPHFPNSQHRPSIITIGLDIPTNSSVQKPRWNFLKGNRLELRKASMKVSIAYHRGVKTTNASANLLSPRPNNIFHEEYENHTYHAGQMKARSYSKGTQRVGIPIPVISS